MELDETEKHPEQSSSNRRRAAPDFGGEAKPCLSLLFLHPVWSLSTCTSFVLFFWVRLETWDGKNNSFVGRGEGFLGARSWQWVASAASAARLVDAHTQSFPMSLPVSRSLASTMASSGLSWCVSIAALRSVFDPSPQPNAPQAPSIVQVHPKLYKYHMLNDNAWVFCTWSNWWLHRWYTKFWLWNSKMIGYSRACYKRNNWIQANVGVWTQSNWFHDAVIHQILVCGF